MSDNVIGSNNSQPIQMQRSGNQCNPDAASSDFDERLPRFFLSSKENFLRNEKYFPGEKRPSYVWDEAKREEAKIGDLRQEAF